MAFHTIFKDLRRQNNLTQDDIAQALSITPQAVSRWECGTAMPDITLVPRLAYLLNVTSDYLLEVDSLRTARDVDVLLGEVSVAFDRGALDDALKILREGLKQYPNNERLLEQLYHVWLLKSSEQSNTKKQNSMYEEGIRIASDLYENSRDINIKNRAANSLFNAYLLREDFAKAYEIADKMPEEVKRRMMIDLEKGEKKIQLLLEEIDHLTKDLCSYSRMLCKEGNYTSEDKSEFLKIEKCLLNAVMSDDTGGYEGGKI